MKRITALFLMTLLIFSMLPVSAFASNSQPSAYEETNRFVQELQHILVDYTFAQSLFLNFLNAGGDVSFCEEDVPSHIKQEVQNNSEYQKKLQYVITKAYDRGSYKVNFISDGTRPSYDEPSIDETLYHQTFAFEAGDMFYAIHGINGRLLIDAVYCGNGLFDVWVAIQDFYDFAYMTDLYNCLSSYGKVEMSRNVQSGNTQNLKSSVALVRLPSAPAPTPGTSQAAVPAGCAYRS